MSNIFAWTGDSTEDYTCQHESLHWWLHSPTSKTWVYTHLQQQSIHLPKVSLHPHWWLHLQPPESSRATFLAIHKNGAYTWWAHIGGLHSPTPETSPFKHQNGAISLTSEWSPHPMSRHWWLGYTHLHQSLLPSYREWSHLLAYNSLELLHQMSWYWWLGYTHFQKSLLLS